MRDACTRCAVVLAPQAEHRRSYVLKAHLACRRARDGARQPAAAARLGRSWRFLRRSWSVRPVSSMKPLRVPAPARPLEPPHVVVASRARGHEPGERARRRVAGVGIPPHAKRLARDFWPRRRAAPRPSTPSIAAASAGYLRAAGADGRSGAKNMRRRRGARWGKGASCARGSRAKRSAKACTFERAIVPGDSARVVPQRLAAAAQRRFRSAAVEVRATPARET